MSVKLLSNLDFAAKINSNEAVTESGKNFIKNYRGYMYQNPASCGIVNGFIQEAKNYSYDTGVTAIVNSITKFINENNISWKLASACEKVSNNNSSYNYIAKLGVSQVEKLLEMNESEVIQYIKGGCLKNVQYIPEFRNVCKEVFQSSIVETHSNTYNTYSPLSYVEVVEGAQYFSVFGNTYKIEEGKVDIAKYEDSHFNLINSLLPSFKIVDESLTYEYKPNYSSEPYKFVISENEIKFSKGNSENVFESVIEFNQFADSYSKHLYINEKHTFMNVCKSIAEVFESMLNIVYIDCAKVMECLDSTKLVIIEAKENINVTVASSVHYGTSSKNYEYISEALAEVEKITGNDIKFLYSNRINEDMKKQDPNAYKSLQEQLNAVKDDQIAYRRKKIAMLAEQFKNDPIKIAIINNIAKELSILENNSAE